MQLVAISAFLVSVDQYSIYYDGYSRAVSIVFLLSSWQNGGLCVSHVAGCCGCRCLGCGCSFGHVGFGIVIVNGRTILVLGKHDAIVATGPGSRLDGQERQSQTKDAEHQWVNSIRHHFYLADARLVATTKLFRLSVGGLSGDLSILIPIPIPITIPTPTSTEKPDR